LHSVTRSSARSAPATPLSKKAAGKRLDLTPKELQVLDLIENLIVPALVEKYIAEKVLNREVNRG